MAEMWVEPFSGIRPSLRQRALQFGFRQLQLLCPQQFRFEGLVRR